MDYKELRVIEKKLEKRNVSREHIILVHRLGTCCNNFLKSQVISKDIRVDEVKKIVADLEKAIPPKENNCSALSKNKIQHYMQIRRVKQYLSLSIERTSDPRALSEYVRIFLSHDDAFLYFLTNPRFKVLDGYVLPRNDKCIVCKSGIEYVSEYGKSVSLNSLLYECNSFVADFVGLRRTNKQITDKDVAMAIVGLLPEDAIYNRLEGKNNSIYNTKINSFIFKNASLILDECLSNTNKMIRSSTYAEDVIYYSEQRGIYTPTQFENYTNVSYKEYSFCKKYREYKPSKRRIPISVSFGLNLPLFTALNLIEKAGYHLSETNTLDFFLIECLKHDFYDFEAINEGLIYLGANDSHLLGIVERKSQKL